MSYDVPRPTNSSYWQPRYVDSLLGKAASPEPVTVDELKAWLRKDDSSEDVLLGELITSARQSIEDQTGVLLVSRAFQLFNPRFAGDPSRWWDGVIEGPETWINNYVNADFIIHRQPVSSVASIHAFGADGTDTTVDTTVYEASFADTKQPARIRLQFGQVWPPIILRTIDGILINFVAGYSPAGTENMPILPMDLKLAIRVVAAELYAKRGDGLQLITGLAGSSAWQTISRYTLPRIAG